MKKTNAAPTSQVGSSAPNQINRPAYYRTHPTGIECITVAEEFNFNLGNVIKYVWRAGVKSSSKIEDLQKAKQYIEFEIARLERAKE